MRTGCVFVALALAACGQPDHPPAGTGDLPYPRLASYRLGPLLDDAERVMLHRVALAIVDAEAGALDPTSLTDARAHNRTLQLAAALAAEAIPPDPNAVVHPLADARFDRVPADAWVVTAGSTTSNATSATDTRIAVGDVTVFSVTTPPSYLLIGGEHVKLVAIEGSDLVVERGYRSQPAAYPPGTRIATHVEAPGGAWLVDITHAAWRDLFAGEVAAMIAAGPWTGLFLTDCTVDLSTLPVAVDLDRNGVADDPGSAAQAWSAGLAALLSELRAQLGDSAPLIADAGAADCAGGATNEALDGILQGGFPAGLAPGTLAFDIGFDRYIGWTSRSDHAPLSVLEAYAPDIGIGTLMEGDDDKARVDYAAMRFGLATALMGDGYFAFDNGTLGRDVAWWYDEYDGAGLGVGWLGHPVGPATRVGGGAYVRTFTRGMAIVNPTSTPLTVTVPPGHHTLAGTQDPVHDDGTEVTGQLVVNGHDGYLLPP